MTLPTTEPAAKLRMAICDDEPIERAHLRMLVQTWTHTQQHPVDIQEFDSAEAFLFAYSEDAGFDAVLLDIQMGAMDGVTLAKRLRAAGAELHIIFITGLPDYIAEGYEVQAVHYLMKPVDEGKLFAALDRVMQRLKTAEPILLLESGTVRLLQKDILYCEAFVHTVAIHTRQGVQEFRLTMAELMQALDENAFARCHRSYIVGLRYVLRITKDEVVLENAAIPLSRRMYHDTHQAFIRFYGGLRS